MCTLCKSCMASQWPSPSLCEPKNSCCVLRCPAMRRTAGGAGDIWKRSRNSFFTLPWSYRKWPASGPVTLSDSTATCGKTLNDLITACPLSSLYCPLKYLSGFISMLLYKKMTLRACTIAMYSTSMNKQAQFGRLHFQKLLTKTLAIQYYQQLCFCSSKNSLSVQHNCESLQHHSTSIRTTSPPPHGSWNVTLPTQSRCWEHPSNHVFHI